MKLKSLLKESKVWERKFGGLITNTSEEEDTKTS